MKRSDGIQLFIDFAFGMALGCSITLAMERASVFFTLVSIVIYMLPRYWTWLANMTKMTKSNVLNIGHSIKTVPYIFYL